MELYTVKTIGTDCAVQCCTREGAIAHASESSSMSVHPEEAVSEFWTVHSVNWSSLSPVSLLPLDDEDSVEQARIFCDRMSLSAAVCVLRCCCCDCCFFCLAVVGLGLTVRKTSSCWSR